MILAGIDEAGLGPNVGPLATACAALSVPDGWRPETPWEKLDAVFCRQWRKKETRYSVMDSKIVYSAGGLAALERTLDAFARLAGRKDWPEWRIAGAFENDCVADDSAMPCAQAAPQLHPCYPDKFVPFAYRRAGAAEPAAAAGGAAAETDIDETTLANCFSRSGAAPARLAVRILYEPVLNARFAAGLNKNQALLMETGAQLAALEEAFPGQRILAVVDKQGGRNDYLPFLSQLFPGLWLETVEAGAEQSVYRVRRAGGIMEIRFVAKGDRDSFATALASMAAKYAREIAMEKLNAWFCRQVPGLKKTAGYPSDARRWRSDVAKMADADTVLLDRVWRVK